MSFVKAFKLPITVGRNTHIIGNGKIVITEICGEVPHIYIGCNALEWMGNRATTVLSIKGTLQLSSDVFIGSGCRFEIAHSGQLRLKRGVVFTGASTVICKKEIEFGENDLISWDTLFMDSDAHTIIDQNGDVNCNGTVKINDHVWIGAKATVLKSTIIAKDNVVACNSLVRGSFNKTNCIIGGNVAKIVKNDINWNIDMPKDTY